MMSAAERARSRRRLVPSESFDNPLDPVAANCRAHEQPERPRRATGGRARTLSRDHVKLGIQLVALVVPSVLFAPPKCGIVVR